MVSTIRTKSDKGMSKRYRVTIEGEYFTTEDGHQVMRAYRESFIMSQKLMELGDTAPQHVWKNHKHKEVMRAIDPKTGKAKYPGFAGLATYNLAEVEPMDGSELADPRFMNFKQLLAYIEENDYPIITALHEDADALRDAVIEWERAVIDRKTDLFTDRQNKRWEVRRQKVDIMGELARIDSENVEEREVVDDEQPAKQPGKPGRPPKNPLGGVV